jgi:hypothetical protein
MSCARGANRIANLAQRVGIPRLASRNAFYAGLAAGAVGLVIGGLVAARRYRPRLAKLRRFISPSRTSSVKSAVLGDVPTLPSRAGLMPADVSKLSGDCPTCHALPRSKPGMWYVIGGDPYCQDCAPEAARQAGMDLGIPPLSGVAGSGMSRPETDDDDQGDDFSPGRRVDLMRVEGRVRVRVVTDGDNVGQWYFHDKAYLLLDEDGQETGLAITPAVDALRDSDGDVVKNERGRTMLRSTTGQWYLTHVGTGNGIAGPFDSVDQAHGLASILAQLDWRRERLMSFSPRERRHIGRVLASYEPGLGAYELRHSMPRSSGYSMPHSSGYRQPTLGPSPKRPRSPSA